MHSRQYPVVNPHAARVILWDCPPGSPSEPKIIHSLKISPSAPVDCDAHERGNRETICLEQEFIELPRSGSIRETLDFIPQDFFPLT